MRRGVDWIVRQVSLKFQATKSVQRLARTARLLAKLGRKVANPVKTRPTAPALAHSLTRPRWPGPAARTSKSRRDEGPVRRLSPGDRKPPCCRCICCYSVLPGGRVCMRQMYVYISRGVPAHVSAFGSSRAYRGVRPSKHWPGSWCRLMKSENPLDGWPWPPRPP